MFKSLREAFRSRFMVGTEYKPYLPPVRTKPGQKPDALEGFYRDPAPASQEAPDIPRQPPEVIFDTAYFKRNSMKLAPPPGADKAEFDFYANPGTLAPNEMPRHIPHTWYMYDKDVLRQTRKMYVESGGLVAAGVYQPDSLKCWNIIGWTKDRPEQMQDRPGDSQDRTSRGDGTPVERTQ